MSVTEQMDVWVKKPTEKRPTASTVVVITIGSTVVLLLESPVGIN